MGELRSHGFRLHDFSIDVAGYERYIRDARYHQFPNYYRGGHGANFAEKSLEHYLVAILLDLQKDDVYIDIANNSSPTPEIYHRLYGCNVYRQDLLFSPGIHGNVIGGDAGAMPVADGFATKMALHCSFEHFEQDADIRFVAEAGRVLSSGGKLCIVPLYLFTAYAIQTDPAVLPMGGLAFDRDAILYCARGWGERHGRFYDVPQLIARIGKSLDALRLTVYVVRNAPDIDPWCYVKFVALCEKA